MQHNQEARVYDMANMKWIYICQYVVWEYNFEHELDIFLWTSGGWIDMHR